MSLGKFLDPKNDLAFKRIFGSEKNKDILIHFLNDIFAGQTSPVQNVTFLKSIQEPEIASQRVSIVDIMCDAANGDRFIVEMQVMHEKGFEKRAQFYAARAYIDQRQAGTQYKDLKQVIFLAITDFTLFPNKPGYLSHHHVLDVVSHERELKDFSFSFLELPKFKKTKNELKTIVDKWAYFFKNAPKTSEDDLEKITGSDPIIQRAYEELNQFSWSPGDLLNYNSIEMKISADRAILETAREEGELKGWLEGELKGKLDEKYETARFLLKEKFDLDKISQITRLRVEEIKKLS